MKRCARCKATKPIEDFTMDRARPDGHSPYCRSCQRANERGRYGRRKESDPEAYRRLLERAKKRYQQNKVARNAWQKEYRRRNAEKVRRGKERHMLRTKYGMTDFDLQRMLVAQNHQCAICERPEIGSRRLAIDHDHETAVVRGLLCSRCNLTLGWLEFLDGATAWVETARNYLRKGSARTAA